MRFRSMGAAAAALVLTACASAVAPVEPRPPAPAPAPPTQPAPSPASRAVSFATLPGWAQDDHAAAFSAFRETCSVARDAAVAGACRRARSLGPLDQAGARAFFETNFRPERVGAPGVLTAYFAPVYEARAARDAEFSAPVRPKPADLVTVDSGLFDPALTGQPTVGQSVDGWIVPYPDRSAIESRPAGKPLAWMRPEDLFFLQIQGSGVLVFPDGRRQKALYAAHNGRPFVGIARPMREQGLLAPDNTSGDAIRAWLAERRGPEAEAVMRLNPRYVFFRLAPDDGRNPAGAAGVPLPPGRAIAVDTARHGFGDLFWLDAEAPVLAGAFPAYRRLAVALDVGGAIKGESRADLYLGIGPQAGAEAGRVRHALHMYRLVPLGEPRS